MLLRAVKEFPEQQSWFTGGVDYLRGHHCWMSMRMTVGSLSILITALCASRGQRASHPHINLRKHYL
ncbi:hypothetical protein BC936DRAFT_140883 [Jimgerdemannia flammicorona]|uniref:Uncharacterized protein n=1 Tax=Jimgerdemannia flammicorona TaxID=994334 RepID=A0A433DMP1_9FUNG|nr:hypothetical protein BC936DRAFT_140883 [Jimgerdemannia flammicorona]